MKKLYNILLIFGLLCAAPAFSMGSVTNWLEKLYHSCARFTSKDERCAAFTLKNPHQGWNFYLGFLSNLYTYKTWYGALGCNLVSAGVFTKEPRVYIDKYQDYAPVVVSYGVGAVAGWATKKLTQKIVPYVWSAAKKLRR